MRTQFGLYRKGEGDPLDPPPPVRCAPVVLTQLAKSVTGSVTTLLTISNEEIEDMKIVKSFGDSVLLIKRVIKTNKNEAKGGNFGMLLGILAAYLLGNMLADKDERWCNDNKFFMSTNQEDLIG